jgi:phosphoglycolate phosphatase
MDPIRDAELICFDNDGTLFASHEVANPAIQRRFVRFCREHGLDLPPPTDEEICFLTGRPGHEFYSQILPDSLKPLAEELRQQCLTEEVGEILQRGRLYPGISELLRDLRGENRRLALVTNAGDRYASAVAERVGYGSLLDGIYHHAKDGMLTKAEMIRAALRDLRAGTAVMVGDRASDLEGARQAGAAFVGCLYGYGSRSEIEGADRLVGTVEELGAALRRRP